MSDMQVETLGERETDVCCTRTRKKENTKEQQITALVSRKSGRTRTEVRFLASEGIDGTSQRTAIPWRSSAVLHPHPLRSPIQRANNR